MSLTEQEQEYAKRMIKKAKEHNFHDDTLIVMGGIALNDASRGVSIELFDKMTELIDKFPDEAEFLDEALKLVGIE